MPSFVLLSCPGNSRRITCSCWCCFKILLLVLKPNKHHHLRREKRGGIRTKQTRTDFLSQLLALESFLRRLLSRQLHFPVLPDWAQSNLFRLEFGLPSESLVWFDFLVRQCVPSTSASAQARWFPEEPSRFFPIHTLHF